MKKILLLLFIGLFTTFFLTGQNLPVKRFALFIGANQGGPGREALLYAQRDAQKVARVMEEVGGVSKDDERILLDPKPQKILDTIEDLSQTMQNATRQARRTEFLFYYSGHSDEQGLLLGNSSWSYKDLRTSLQKLPADVKIAILDSCSSGAFARLKGGVQRAPFLEQENSQMKGHAFLTSSSENEASQESDTLQGSFFTHYLVSGLRGGADRAKDGMITLNEAYEYAFQNTLQRTETTKAGPQHPSYEIQLSGTGDLVLTDLKAANSMLQLHGDVVGKLYVRSEEGVLFAELEKAPGTPARLALPAGIYVVTSVTPQKASIARVSLSASKTTLLQSSDLKPQRLERNAVRGQQEEPDETTVSPLFPFSIGFVPGLEIAPPGSRRNMSAAALIDVSAGVHGLQTSGLLSISTDIVDGVQTAGIGSIAMESFQGVQSSGIFNIAQGEDNQYLQAAGIFNLDGGNFTGFQGAGIFNLVDKDLAGFQAAGIFNRAGNVSGGQVGLVNIAENVQGVQVGLVNINRHIDGTGIGLIFISPDAYYHPTLLIDQDGNDMALLQWGLGWFYWVLGGSSNVLKSTDTDWKGFMGVGVKWENQHAFFDVDGGLIGSQMFSPHSNTSPFLGTQPFLRATTGIKAGWVGFEAGCLMNVGITGVTDQTTLNSSGFGGGSVPIAGRQIYWTPTWFAGVRFF